MPPASKTTGNYANSTLAKMEALNAGYDEAVMLNKEGLVAECSGENISKALTTPSFVETQKETKEKVGNLTIRHIEEGRQALREQIKEAREEEYEPS